MLEEPTYVINIQAGEGPPKAAPVKYIPVSAEARQAYEETIRQQDQRSREHTHFLPEEHKGKR